MLFTFPDKFEVFKIIPKAKESKKKINIKFRSKRTKKTKVKKYYLAYYVD